MPPFSIIYWCSLNREALRQDGEQRTIYFDHPTLRSTSTRRSTLWTLQWLKILWHIHESTDNRTSLSMYVYLFVCYLPLDLKTSTCFLWYLFFSNYLLVLDRKLSKWWGTLAHIWLILDIRNADFMFVIAFVMSVITLFQKLHFFL